MAVNLSPPRPEDLLPVKGVKLGVAEAGIRKAGRKDLLLMTLAEGTRVAGAFTQNRFCAAPVQVAKEHLASGRSLRAFIVNTGNANAGTGKEGLARAKASCGEAARLLGCDSRQVLPFSTGVLMEPLPLERIVAGLPACVADLCEDNWARAAETIMTTDTVPKARSQRARLESLGATVTGIAKGAGMIRPDMATMLGFIATDAAVSLEALQHLVAHAAARSFNRISIDGDTSTNDSFMLIATGAGGNARIRDLDVGRVELYLDDVSVSREGGRAPGYREEDGQRVMRKSEITVRVVLNRGNMATEVWTCDLSHDYVTINSEYRT